MEPRGARPAEVPDRGELDLVERLSTAVGIALKGKPETIRLGLTALLARGHLLVEDVPGVGKTTLAAALARAVGGRFVRVQFTSDMLPSDLIGVSVFDPQARRFEFRPGPIFANVVLADEINRTTPKTQSALLEAMSERRVSADGVTRSLPDPFFVVATQNPVEHHGTFPLPDSQLDRFLLRIDIGYPSPADERAILASDRATRDVDEVPAVTEPEGLALLQQAVERVRASEPMLDYVVALAHATRRAPGVSIGVSPRGSLALLRASRATALIAGRDYIVPDDVKEIAAPALAHRLVMEGAEDGADPEAAREVIREVLETVPVPR
jgi:MoxR-like ATPase